MNYFEHNNCFYRLLDFEDRFSPHHISMYYVLFNIWNKSLFKPTISIYRDHIMSKSKIGSVNAYYKCLKQLQDWGYLEYFPAKNGTYTSTIKMTVLTDNLVEQIENSHIKIARINTSAVSNLIQALSFADSNLIQANTSNCIKNDISNASPIRHIEKNNNIQRERRILPTHISLNKNVKVLKKEKKKISPPSIDNVISFFTSMNKSSLEGEKFYYHYNSKNWKIKNDTITDWESLARKWMLNEFQSHEPNSKIIDKNIDYDTPF